MVHDSVVGTRYSHRVTGILTIDTQAALETDMAADHVRTDIDVRCLDTDALAWCRLSGDIGEGLGELRLEVEFDDT